MGRERKGRAEERSDREAKEGGKGREERYGRDRVERKRAGRKMREGEESR